MPPRILAASFAALALAAGAAVLAHGQTRFSPRDLDGVWTNASLTPMDRPAEYGDRRALTAAEAARIEGANNIMLAERAAPTPDAATVEDAFCDPINCGYNQFWVDPGETVMRVGGEPRTSFITSPANGRAPPRIGGGGGGGGGGGRGGQAAQRQAAQAEVQSEGPPRRGEFLGRNSGYPGQNDNPETRAMGERCLTFGNVGGPVMLPTLYNNTYQFVLSPTSMAIWVEMVHDVRVVRIGGKHRTDGVRTYYGDSIGWWEGDTLVTETINFHPTQAYRGASAGLKVTERFTRVAPDRLRYQFTLEDPAVWATPWGGEYEFAKARGRVYEYACHEGNYGLENILAGARHEEEEAAAAARPARP